MLKLLGIMCILGGCIGWGYGRAREEKSRIYHLREIIRIIRRIQSEMEYGKRTLPEICAVLAACSSGRYRLCFENIYEHMARRDGTGIEQVWKEQTEECLKGVPLLSEEKDALCTLPQNLGMPEETLQAVNIGQSLDMMEQRLKQAEESYSGKVRMILSVSALAGIFIVILIL